MLRSSTTLLLSLLFAAVGFAQDAKVAETVSFAWRAPKAGDKVAVSRDLDVDNDMTVSVMGQEQKMEQAQKSKQTLSLEILGVNAGGDPVKVKVEVRAWDEKMEGPMGEMDMGAEKAVMVGQVFVLDMSQSPASVTDASGEAVEKSLADAARKEFVGADGSFKFRRMHAKDIVPDSMRIGESIKLDKDRIERLLMADDNAGAEVSGESSGTLTLTEVREVLGNKVGVFKLDAMMKMKPDVGEAGEEMAPDMAIESKTTGEILVGLSDKYLHKATFDGDIKTSGGMVQDMGDGNTFEMEINGTGKVKGVVQMIFSKTK